MDELPLLARFCFTFQQCDMCTHSHRALVYSDGSHLSSQNLMSLKASLCVCVFVRKDALTMSSVISVYLHLEQKAVIQSQSISQDECGAQFNSKWKHFVIRSPGLHGYSKVKGLYIFKRVADLSPTFSP